MKPFSFSIIEMQYLSSNAPSIISYTSLGTEILIICRTTSDFNRIKKSFETPVSRRLISELNRDPLNKIEINPLYIICVIYKQNWQHLGTWRGYGHTIFCVAKRKKRNKDKKKDFKAETIKRLSRRSKR